MSVKAIMASLHESMFSLSKVGQDTKEDSSSLLSFSFKYCNEVVTSLEFKKSSLSEIKKTASPAQVSAIASLKSEQDLYLYTHRDWGKIPAIITSSYACLVGPDGKFYFTEKSSKDTPMQGEPLPSTYDEVEFSYLREKEDFPAGWYHIGTYTKSTDKVNSLIIKLTAVYKNGIPKGAVFVPLNSKYYIEGVGPGIPRSVFLQIQKGLVEPHDSYSQAKSDVVDYQKVKAAGVFTQEKREMLYPDSQVGKLLEGYRAYMTVSGIYIDNILTKTTKEKLIESLKEHDLVEELRIKRTFCEFKLLNNKYKIHF